MEFKFDDDILKIFKNILPPSELEDDIRTKRKIVVPIIVAQDGTVLDGYHRLMFARKCGILDAEVPYQVEKVKDREEMLQLAVDLNVKRRQLNNFCRAMIAVEYWIPKFEGRVGRPEKIGFGKSNLEEGKSADLAAERVGLKSDDLVTKMKIVKLHATPEEIQAGLRDEVTVSGLYEKYKKEEKKVKTKEDLIKKALSLKDEVLALGKIEPKTLDVLYDILEFLGDTGRSLAGDGFPSIQKKIDEAVSALVSIVTIWKHKEVIA